MRAVGRDAGPCRARLQIIVPTGQGGRLEGLAAHRQFVARAWPGNEAGEHRLPGHPGEDGLGAHRAIFLAHDAGPIHGPGQAAAAVHKGGARRMGPWAAYSPLPSFSSRVMGRMARWDIRGSRRCSGAGTRWCRWSCPAPGSTGPLGQRKARAGCSTPVGHTRMHWPQRRQRRKNSSSGREPGGRIRAGFQLDPASRSGSGWRGGQAQAQPSQHPAAAQVRGSLAPGRGLGGKGDVVSPGRCPGN